MRDRLHLTLRSSPAEIGRLGEAFEVFADRHGLAAEVRCAVNLALEEFVLNVIHHGYRGRDTETIDVEVTLEPAQVVVAIEDHAPPYDPLQAPEPDLSLPLEERPQGGLGIHLVKSMMDRLEYTSTAGRNRLTLWKHLAQG